MEPSLGQKRRIHQRAKQFVQRWTRKHNINECSESQTFINEFFDIFDIDRFASNIYFEYSISKNGDKRIVDVFWPGVILIENKTPGKKNLDKADEQVRQYLDMIKKKDRPQYALINNFRRFRIYEVKSYNEELTMSQCVSFSIEDLPKEIHRFYYFLSHQYSKTIKEVVEKLVEKIIEKIVEKIVYKTRYGILILASSLSLALGYIISDGQPREYLERFMGGSAREESTR